ncbi:MAG TPA: ABC transporter substrate-binding protein, partial [Acidiferrobacterales bacterium]|nr:ABC transporter substrate-binding protein [Acidiferrobacterales bacterium]
MRNRLFKLLLAVFAGMAVYYQARAADKDPAEIKWGYVTSTAYYWDVFAAMDKGFMRRQGLTVSPTKIDAASQSIQFVLTGAVDIVSTIPDLVINAIDKGGSLVIIGNEVTKVPWALMARPEIKTFADLKGKTIGVSAINDASTFLLRLLLQKQGLKPGDYQTIQLGGTPNRYAALHKGAVQATLLAQPADFKAESEGMRRLGSVDQAFEGPAIVYVARKDWVKANGDKVVRFLRGAMQGAQWLYDP